MARILIAASLLLQGDAQTTPPVTPGTLTEIFPDVSDGSCTAGSYCSTGAGITTPRLRGLCVSAAAGQQCWDACNPAHDLHAYGLGQNDATQKAIAMMVNQLRTGQRYGACPGSQSASAQAACIVGERCTPPGLTLGRGMCITLSDGQKQTDQCLDMCDTSIPLTTYKNTPGYQSGTLKIVQQVQAGRDPAGRTTCPAVSVWVWLWVPLLLCCCIGVCAASYVGYTSYVSRLKRSNYREPRENEAFVEEQGAPYENYQDQGQPYYQDDQMPPPQTMDVMEDAGPMPVLEPQQEPLLQQAEVQPLKADMNLFEAPNLMGGLAPITVAAPAAYPMAGSNYMTYPQASYTQYPAQSSMTVQQPMYTAAPQYTTPQYTSVQMTQPTYGAYGAYGGVTTSGVQPASYAATTTSMRIG
jgi:hypothetical protein